VTKAIRTKVTIYEQMHVVEFAIDQLRELADDCPPTVRMEVNDLQEVLDLLRYKLHEQRKADTRAGLRAKKLLDQELPYLVPLTRADIR
jgi:hypothetical protein